MTSFKALNAIASILLLKHFIFIWTKGLLFSMIRYHCYLFCELFLLSEQLDFRRNISTRMQKFEKNFHSQHIHFQDMSKGVLSMDENSMAEVFEEPVYMNVIREPIARFISHFYYRRFNSGHKVLFYLLQ